MGKSIFQLNTVATGIDLSKTLGGKPNYWEEMMAITDERIRVSLLLGAHAWAATQSTPIIDYDATGD